MNNKFKQKIAEAILRDAQNYPSASKHAKALGINAAQLSRIKRGDLERVLSDANWINIARRLGVEPGEGSSWKIARTPVFDYITEQLAFCQRYHVSAVLVDVPDIGKTFTAKHYVRTHPNAVYIDGSLHKRKQQLIRAIAREFGVEHTGRYVDVFADLTWYLRSLDNPLVIIDEAGDLDYAAFLELKALWNATEGAAAYYLMGADGLKVKIEKGRERKKVGYAEIFSRFGDGFKRISPETERERRQFKRMLMNMVARANGLNEPETKLYARTGGSLRRVYIEYQKRHESH